MEEMPVCTNCIRKTGGCCTNVHLIIHSSEITPFLKAKDSGLFTKSHVLEKWNDNKDLYVYTSTDQRCIFLSTNNTCLIYEKRPTICRLYPVVWKTGIIEPFNIYIDLLCPLSHVVPIIDIYKPSKKMINKELMKKIGSLNFDDNDCSYLNITDKKQSSDGLKALYDEEL